MRIIHGTNGNDVLSGAIVTGKKQADHISGSDKYFSYLFGNRGADTLHLGEAGGVAKGGRGSDALFAYDGDCVMVGGRGADTFFIESLDANVVIRDFGRGHDALWFSVGGGLFGHPDKAEFTIGPEATTAEHRVIYDDTTGQLFYDPDGAGGVDQQLIAKLSHHPDLHRGDIFIDI